MSRIGRRIQRTAAHLALQQRQRQQRRMAFVHVIDIHLQAQGIRHAHAAQSQHDLLLQAVVRVAAVQVIGQPAIPSRIAIEVRVQQVDRNDMSVAAFAGRSAMRARLHRGLPLRP